MTTDNILGKRIAAVLIDGLLVAGLSAMLNGLGVLLGAAYWLFRDALFRGQSVGKRVMELRVVVHPDRQPCAAKQSVIRNVLWVVPLINLVMAVSAAYYVLKQADGRHWGDRLADTQVVRA
jgi:uncharacterized RDD family membrane protein YckC